MPVKIESRPLLTGPDPASTVDRLLKKRTPIYELCEKSITTTARSVDDVVAEIMRSLQLERTQRTVRAEVPAALLNHRPSTEDNGVQVAQPKRAKRLPSMFKHPRATTK